MKVKNQSSKNVEHLNASKLNLFQEKENLHRAEWLENQRSITEFQQHNRRAMYQPTQLPNRNTVITHIIGAPKMQNNFWCTVKLFFLSSTLR